MEIYQKKMIISLMFIFIICLLLLHREKLPNLPPLKNIDLRKFLPASARTSVIVDQLFKKNAGNSTYKVIFENVYTKHGYSLCLTRNSRLDSPFLPLVKAKFSCKGTFLDWLTVNKKPTKQMQKGKPPANMPAEKKDEYLLYGYSAFRKWFFTSEEVNMNVNPLVWNTNLLNSYISTVKAKQWNQFTYGADASGLAEAFKHYTPSGRGLVIGSLSPWVEAICLAFGAHQVTTSEYQPIKTKDSRVTWMHPVDLAKSFLNMSIYQFDFAVSFSSLEHSGLGRFGDNLDPFGDVKEMEKTWCLLKPSGLFFIGLPTGPDLVAWNAGRVYGHVRWPMMMAGFELVDAFYRTNGRVQFNDTKFWAEGGFGKQPVLVLRKTESGDCINF